MVDINFNSRVLPTLEVKPTDKPLTSYSIKRVCRAVLPIFTLYPPIGNLIQVGMTIHDIVVDIYTFDIAHGGKKEVAQIAVKVATVAGMILAPLITTTVHHTYAAGCHLIHTAQALRKGEYKIGFQETLLFAHEVVYLASLYLMQPEILAISLISQAIFEACKSIQFGKADLRLECIIHLALTMIRTYAAGKQIERVHRNWFGESLTLETLQEIFQHFASQVQSKWKKTETKIDLDAEFSKRNISNRIENLKFTDRELDQCRLDHLSFHRCDFSGSKLTNCRFDRVIFDQTNLKKTKFIQADFSNTLFSHSKMIESQFIRCAFQQSQFYHCNLNTSNFFGSRFQESAFIDSKLNEANFFQTSIEETKMVDCELIDTVLSKSNVGFSFEGTSVHVKTKPVIALEGHLSNGTLQWVDGVADALEDQGAITLSYHYLHTHLSEDKLKRETDAALQRCAFAPQPEHLSRADQVLRTADPQSEIAKIRTFANTLADYADGVVIPGGADVHPAFYGGDIIYAYRGYHHDLMNFAAVQAFNDQRKPIMGICRGSQLGNVFFGGTLHQHVDDQWGRQTLQVTSNIHPAAEKVFKQIVPSTPIQGISAHHQANKKLGIGLHTVLEVDGISKAIVDETGRIILTQFHPETYVYMKKERAEERFQQIINNQDSVSSPIDTTIEGNASFYTHFLEHAKKAKVRQRSLRYLFVGC